MFVYKINIQSLLILVAQALKSVLAATKTCSVLKNSYFIVQSKNNIN